MSLWPQVREQLNDMVNRHFDTPEYHQLFSVKLTPARQKIWDMHYPHYIKSRRDCWGAAAVKAPLDVKRAIWEHAKASGVSMAGIKGLGSIACHVNGAVLDNDKGPSRAGMEIRKVRRYPMNYSREADS